MEKNIHTNCQFSGFSYEGDTFIATIGFSKEKGTFSAVVSKQEEDEKISTYSWGTIPNEYPTLWPLIYLVCNYIGSYSWFTIEMYECLRKISADHEFVYVGTEFGPLMDALGRRIYEYRLGLDHVAKKKFKEAAGESDFEALENKDE